MSEEDWILSPKQARAVQEQLRVRVIPRDRLGRVRRVAGVDVGFECGGKVTRAAVVVLSFPALEPLEQAVARRPTTFPYIPGLLSFRELPVILEALGQLSQSPDLLLCDGQGYAHPRRFGLACHLGVWTDLASIGVAKSRLIGEHRPVGQEKGDFAGLYQDGERIGAVVRTRRAVRPVFVSLGHRVGLETAIHYTLACTSHYRLPETTRHAHRLASADAVI